MYSVKILLHAVKNSLIWLHCSSIMTYIVKWLIKALLQSHLWPTYGINYIAYYMYYYTCSFHSDLTSALSLSHLWLIKWSTFHTCDLHSDLPVMIYTCYTCDLHSDHYDLHLLQYRQHYFLQFYNPIVLCIMLVYCSNMR